MCSPNDPPSDAERAFLGMSRAERKAWSDEVLHTWMRQRLSPERYGKWLADVEQARREDEAREHSRGYRAF